MGAGSFAAGLGRAGHDPIATPGPSEFDEVAGSPKFDPLTKTYPATDDGGVEEVDPIWQEIAHRLGIPLGALSFAPDLGIDAEAIKNATASNAQRTVEDTVKRALGPMIPNGDVELVRVVLALPWSGKWEAWVKNLRDPESDTNPRAFTSS